MSHYAESVETETRVSISPQMLRTLVQIVGAENVISGEDELLVYECDAYTLEKNLPNVVVLPRTTEEVSKIAVLCAEQNVPIIPRGAGTSLSGAVLAVTGGVMIALGRMNKILEIDYRNRRALVEAGCVNAWVTNAVKARGFPNHVLGFEMVLPDGKVVWLGTKPDGGEETGGYDLRGAVIGCEGMFGIITRVLVRLIKAPQAYKTMLAVFESVDDASQTVSDIIAAGIVPGAMEMMDQLITQAIEAAYQFGFPLDAGAVLIVELDGLSAGLEKQAERVIEICKTNRAREVRTAKTEQERMDLWKCRKRAFGAIGRLSPNFLTQDGVVPRSKVPEIMRFIRATSEKYGLRIPNVFHAGDGNIHPLVLYDEREREQVDRAVAAGTDILQKCIELGGSVTGEHGIGVEKIDFMEKQFTKDDLDAMRALRRVFDPEGRCNPHKIFPGSKRCSDFAPRKQIAA